jgi:two-component system CheB/CheR fusion protein
MPSKSSKKTPPKPSHIVGIGASAGGLEAIEAFFKNMPPNSNLAFVVVQHLSPDYKSLMVELLSKKTEMPVHRAEDGMEVVAGNVYLIPPKKNLTIFHGTLLLNDKVSNHGINLPIDIFLRSLAEDQGEQAIAIILSGSGSDGTRGVRAVKEMGGMVMVQNEESAKFDGMPRAAIATGVADFILPPEEMPAQLLAFVAHPYVAGRKHRELLLKDADGLTRLFAILREHTRVDFTYYKPSTITRRIERRMSVNQISDFEDYVRYLQSYPGEVSTLYRDLLIGVTSFFRDPEAMTDLEERWLPELFSRITQREIRFWVAGCSTGEEAYTIAILTKEVMERLGVSRDVKIFATDIDRDAIAFASAGIYPEGIIGDLTPRITGKYFYHKEEKLQVARHLREMVVFAQHNLIKDPPFTNIDLVSCRNLLIYLQPVLQRKVFEMFNFSLNSQGLLFLGTSETIGDMTDCFDLLHQKHKIYRCKGKTQPLHRDLNVAARDGSYPSQPFAYRGRERRRTDNEGGQMVKAYLELASQHYLPLSVIVNQRMEIIHIVGKAEGYFTLPSGPTDFDITKLAPKDLVIPLATGIQKAFRTGEEISYSDVRLQVGGTHRTIRLRLLPFPDAKGQDPLVAVFFEEVGSPSESDHRTAPAYDLGEEAQQRIRDLEQELQFARENLQATIEELETSNEELQATNEELLASNEELQSTNEELQSTNEELYTVNAEHQNKIIELTELNNDVDNLLTSCRIGILLLDEELEIRKFSPEIVHIFHILEKDIGRPLTHLAHCLREFDPFTAVRTVQQTNQPIEQEVGTTSNRWYLIRILPYAIGPRIYSGIVLTFVDITEARAIKHYLADSRKTTREISRHIPVGLFIYRIDDKGEMCLESCNPEAERMTGIRQEVWGGKPFNTIWPAAEPLGITAHFRQVIETGRACLLDNVFYGDERLEGVFSIQAFLLPDNRLAISFEDVTERQRIRRELEVSEQRYTTLFETMAQGVVYQDREGKIISANPAAERILGLTLDQLTGVTSADPHWRAVDERGAPLEGGEHPAMVALRTGEPVFGFVMGVHNPHTESIRWILVNATPQFQPDESRPYQVYTTFEDITERCKLFGNPSGKACD